jgi:hypothetical protein
MSPSSPILITIDSNEAARPRADLIRKAIETDDRFALSDGRLDTPFDIRFDTEDVCENLNKGINCEPCDHGPCIKNRTLHVEIKDFTGDNNSDYLASILSGHLWEQCLAARELGEPMIIAVLGDDRDVNEAIKAAASRDHRVDAKKLFQYFQMVDGFEANCIGLGIHVWRLKTDPWKRLLLRVRKILEGGNLSGFAPAPADGERQVVGLSILAGRGVGPKMAQNILNRYTLCLVIKDGFCGDLEDCEGIGPVRAETIRKNIEVIE